MINADDIEQRYDWFLNRFGRNITRFCIYYSNGREDAADLMQDIFVAIWCGLPGLRPDCSQRQANRWLYKVMYSVLVKHRRHSHETEFVTEERLDDLLYRNLDGEDNDLGELVDELAAHLQEEDRALVQEIRLGYPEAEIAQRHSISIEALYTRINRLYKKLKTVYDIIYGTK